MPEDDCCVHCGQPRHEIGELGEAVYCDCPEDDRDEMAYVGSCICVACGRPVQKPTPLAVGSSD